MCGIYLCALCKSLSDRIIKLRKNFNRVKLKFALGQQLQKFLSEYISIREVEHSSPELKKGFKKLPISLNLYLGKCLWSTRKLLFMERLFLLAVCTIFGFSCWQRDHSLRTILIGVKPKVCCTPVASVVSLFISVDMANKSLFAIESFDNLHGFSRLLRSATGRLLNGTSHITKGGLTVWYASLCCY